MPDYNYPSLDFLIDSEGTEKHQKTSIYKAVMELEAAKQRPGANLDELELYAAFHEENLKKIMLVEAVRDLQSSYHTSNYETNRKSFTELNESMYGEYGADIYFGMMNTEKQRLINFTPESELAVQIKSDLEKIFSGIETSDDKEGWLLDREVLDKLHKFVVNRYDRVLCSVSDTSDDFYYNASGCAEIMNDALEAGGLSCFDWEAKVDDKVSGVVTSQKTKTIKLPTKTSRTASELRRLIVHECEIHARRGQNGSESGVDPLRSGTANYLPIEEGLAVILECAVEGNLNNKSLDRVRDRYIVAGLAMGADGTPRDARETYEIMWRILAVRGAFDGVISEESVGRAKEEAYNHVENAFRGTPFWMKGVIYSKLKVYYEGLIQNAEYFAKNVNNLEDAFERAMIGKYCHTDDEQYKIVKRAVVASGNHGNQERDEDID